MNIEQAFCVCPCHTSSFTKSSTNKLLLDLAVFETRIRITLIAGSGTAYVSDRKAGSASKSQSRIRVRIGIKVKNRELWSVEAQNGAMEGRVCKIEPLRLKTVQWSICTPVVPDSHHFAESRIRIRIKVKRGFRIGVKVKRGIQIHVKVSRICNTKFILLQC
jgi:hypothetical protein